MMGQGKSGWLSAAASVRVVIAGLEDVVTKLG
jgi:hypothetical protein